MIFKEQLTLNNFYDLTGTIDLKKINIFIGVSYQKSLILYLIFFIKDLLSNKNDICVVFDELYREKFEKLFSIYEKGFYSSIEYKIYFDENDLDNCFCLKIEKKEKINIFCNYKTSPIYYCSPLFWNEDYDINYLLSDFLDRKDKRPFPDLYIPSFEFNLHPRLQYDAVHKLALYLNKNPFPTNVYLITNSPYVLRTLNNLIQAKETEKVILEEGTDKKYSFLNSIIATECRLSFEDVTFYSIENNSIKNQLVSKDCLLDENSINTIAETIKQEFDRLIELELNSEFF